MKKVITSLLIYAGYLIGTALIAGGVYLLTQGEDRIVRNVLEDSNGYKIVLYTGDSFYTDKLNIEEVKGQIEISFDGKKIPLYLVKTINGRDINQEIVERISFNGIAGITLTVAGGFILIMAVLFRDRL
ncbi:hypothetical protein [Persephonella sp.]